jgi:hypothetical protein
MRYHDAAIPSRRQNGRLQEVKEKRKQKTEEKRR